MEKEDGNRGQISSGPWYFRTLFSLLYGLSCLHVFLAACSLRKVIKMALAECSSWRGKYLPRNSEGNSTVIYLPNKKWITCPARKVGLLRLLMPGCNYGYSQMNIRQRLIKRLLLGASHALAEPFLECRKFLKLWYKAGRGRGINWQIEIDIYTLLYIYMAGRFFTIWATGKPRKRTKTKKHVSVCSVSFTSDSLQPCGL